MTGFADRIAALQTALPDLPGVAGLRADGLADLRRHGIPGRKLEAWKFTSLQAAGERDWSLAANDAAPFAAALPQGVTLQPLAQALAERGAELAQALAPASRDAASALTALNAALLRDGWLLEVAPGVNVPRPIHLDLRNQGRDGLANVTCLVRLGAGASASLLESHAGEGWSNSRIKIELAEGAELLHARLQQQTADAFHAGLTEVRLEARAAYRHVSLMLGGAVARHELAVTLAGEGASLDAQGLALAKGSAHLDHTLRLEHAAAGCSSNQLFKNVVDERGHAVFQGLIRVAPGAQKTDAQQLCRTLLLSDDAQVDTKPELEILADDVKCSHGATVGDLDANMLFYLRARGIDANTARRLLLEGFAAEILQAIPAQDMRLPFIAALETWFATGDAA
ncbi:Fe-S cluster assembly protein SufD [Ferrovibrio sp.]|uniref:Fe-S cluster assembly protein SufD n=1 Tax=Ferrovibrio sp. TaxID=1917215 RepID=UPI001B6747ED|nr:Fe-S cluster assembly protein SufD [Ferrovibrio sp.]MBP7063524.1 Fe-S cluster assembly protein SufD [Ferrovibrio sp.]